MPSRSGDGENAALNLSLHPHPLIDEAFIVARVIDGERYERQRETPQTTYTGSVVLLGADEQDEIGAHARAAKSHTRGLDREEPVMYLPLSPGDLERPLTLVARTGRAAGSLARTLRDAAVAVDPNVAMKTVKTMAERAEVQLWPFRTVSWMFTICGTLALILATVGLAGVVIHAVNRRMREFGVRMSIGATRQNLAADVLLSSARLLVPGLVVGLTMAALLARLAQVAFVGVNVLNPATYLAVAVLQSAIVVVACIGPALKASRVDPLIALRSE